MDRIPLSYILTSKMKNKLFSLVLILLFVLGIGIFILPQEEISNQENRNLQTNENIILTKLISTSEKVLLDQFYYRDNILKIYYYVNTSLSSSFGSNVINDVVVSQLTDEVAVLNDGYLIGSPLKYSKAELDSAASHGYNYSEFDLEYPHIKTYVYKCTSMREYVNVDYPYQDICWDAMVYQFNPNITYDKLEINNISDHQKYYYKSDHHWTTLGAYQGYIDIIEMIGKDFDISKPKKIVGTISYSCPFKGSYSHKIASLGESDYIYDYKLDNIGEFDYYINGELYVYFRDTINNKILNEKNSSFISGLGDVFPGPSDPSVPILYDFHNEDKPNLLIFGTSLLDMNGVWIASHFNKTLIFHSNFTKNDYDLKYYIDKYNINIALIAAGADTLYNNGYMYIPLS